MIQVLGIALAVSLAVNAAGGVMLKNAWEGNATLEAALEANTLKAREALAEQQRTIETLQVQRAQDQRLMMTLGAQTNEARRQLDEQTTRLNAWRGRLTQRALEKPQVAERAARIGTRHWMCDVWEASGGARDACPSTRVPPASARAGRPGTTGNPGTDAGRDAGLE